MTDRRQSLNGRVIVITGAARGIGEAAAREFVAAGASTVLIDTDAEGLHRVSSSLGSGVVLARAVDVRAHESLMATAAELAAREQPVDVLVNNAATYTQGALLEVAPADLDRCMQVNALGAIACCRAFVPLMAQRPGAHIVNVLSEFAWLPFPRKGSYCMTKAAAAMASACLRVELRQAGIRVTDFVPPAVDTGLIRSASAVNPELRGREIEVVRRHAWPADAVGRRLVAAVLAPRDRVVCGVLPRLAIAASRWSPSIASRLAAAAAARLGLG